MLTAILVDDDYPVIRYLTHAVPWKELGIELIGSYANGAEAWDAAGGKHPDIIVTDIGMPKMNGLDMLEKFHAANPRVRSVILSCHNEFKYAQQAMKLNAADYILKESLDVDQLRDILAKVAADLGQAMQQEEDVQSYRRKERLNQSALREKFLKDTLYQPYATKEEWIAKARLQGIELDARSYVPILITIDRMPVVTRLRRMNEYTIAFSLENIVHDIADPAEWLTFRYSSRQLVILYRCDAKDNPQQTVHFKLREAIEAVRRYLKFTVTCIWGREASRPGEIRNALLPMLTEPAYRFYWKEASIHRFETETFAREDIYGRYSSLFAELHAIVALNRKESLKEALTAWTAEVRSRKYHPSDVKEFVLQLLIDIQMRMKSSLQYDTLLEGEKLYDAVHELETLDHLEDWMQQYLGELMRRLAMYAISSKRQEIVKAQQYVIANVTEKITLEDMAKHLNLNASYFSRLFKRETTVNFIEYVNMIKLQKAKELLQHTNRSVEEISDYLGYANKSYFIKLFKREIGMKPSDYANGH